MSLKSAIKKISTGTRKTTTKVYVNRKIAGVENTAKKQLLDKFKTKSLKEIAAGSGIKLNRWDDDKEKWVPMTSKVQIVKKLSSKMEYDSVINACRRYKISFKRIDDQVKLERKQLKSKLK